MRPTDYCDEDKLTIDQRLELFVQVCQAIQHAHHKGIIHRDIKPTNVLVTELDGKPVPKVVDFGVAKALNQSLTDRSIYTGFQSVIGTPLYMSPEQASLSAVDTRSDVYSLGVLLYELVTGTTPFEQCKLQEAAQHEVLRIIREEEPPRPSNRISTLGKNASRISQLRQTQSDRLGRLVIAASFLNQASCLFGGQSYNSIVTPDNDISAGLLSLFDDVLTGFQKGRIRFFGKGLVSLGFTTDAHLSCSLDALIVVHFSSSATAS